MIMTKMPKQYYILGLVLLQYLWPWQLFGGDLPADWLVSVITMQLCFVIFCNKFVRDNWILPVIIIEAVSLAFNITLLVVPGVISGIHAHIILTALIMELLIITTSLGVINGRVDSYRLPLAGGGLWRVRGALFCLYRSKESLR
jgi:hypothetical protein